MPRLTLGFPHGCGSEFERFEETFRKVLSASALIETRFDHLATTALEVCLPHRVGATEQADSHPRPTLSQLTEQLLGSITSLQDTASRHSEQLRALLQDKRRLLFNSEGR